MSQKPEILAFCAVGVLFAGNTLIFQWSGLISVRRTNVSLGFITTPLKTGWKSSKSMLPMYMKRLEENNKGRLACCWVGDVEYHHEEEDASEDGSVTYCLKDCRTNLTRLCLPVASNPIVKPTLWSKKITNSGPFRFTAAFPS